MTAFAVCFVVVLAVLSVANAFVATKQASFFRRGDVSMMARTPLVAGNWKMNTDLQSAVALATELAELTASVDGRAVEIAVCPPFPFLRDVKMVICLSVCLSVIHVEHGPNCLLVDLNQYPFLFTLCPFPIFTILSLFHPALSLPATILTFCTLSFLISFHSI